MGFLLTHSSAKSNRIQRTLSVFLAALLLISLVLPVLGSVGEDAYVNDDAINVRSGPGTSYSSVRFGKSKAILLYRGRWRDLVSDRIYLQRLYQNGLYAQRFRHPNRR